MVSLGAEDAELAEVQNLTAAATERPHLPRLQIKPEALVHADERDGGLLHRELATWAASHSSAKGHPAMLRTRCCLRRAVYEALRQVGLRVLTCMG